MTLSAFAQSASFTDINDHWAKTDILNLSHQGLIAGHGDGQFKPYDYITQAQFLNLMAQASHRNQLEQLPTFRHIITPHPWKASAVSHVQQAPTHHIADQAMPEAIKKPAQYITRTEALALTVDIAQYPPVSRSQTQAILAPYEDAKQLPQWSQSHVASAVQQGLFSSAFPHKKAFRGDQYLRRGEAAHLINLILLKNN
jgi:hypothetical protein